MQVDRTGWKLDEHYWSLDLPTIVVEIDNVPVHINRKHYGHLNEEVRRPMNAIISVLVDQLYIEKTKGVMKWMK